MVLARDRSGGVRALAAGPSAARRVAKGRPRARPFPKNSELMLFSMFAAFRLGAVWVPTNFRLMPDEIVHLARAFGREGLPVPWRVSRPRCASVARDGAGGRVHLADRREGGFRRGQRRRPDRTARPRRRRCRMRRVEHDDPCWFFFTSGTTGRSKAAVLTHGQMALCRHQPSGRPRCPARHRDRCVAGRGAAQPWRRRAPAQSSRRAARATMLLPDGPLRHRGGLPADRPPPRHQHVHGADDPRRCWPSIRRRTASTIPRCRLVIYAGAPMYREDQKTGARRARHGDRAVFRPGRGDRQHHGAAAAPCMIPRTAPTRSSAPAASSARACRCSIQDDSRRASSRRSRPARSALQGRPCSPAITTIPKANAKAFRNGWFRTGDLGHMDAQGFVYITGRASDMYISGGSNIYPREIEEKILTHPGHCRGGCSAAFPIRSGARSASRSACRAEAAHRRDEADGWRSCAAEDQRATSCRSASCSGRRCRNRATARCPSAWCATSSRSAA